VGLESGNVSVGGLGVCTGNTTSFEDSADVQRVVVVVGIREMLVGLVHETSWMV
jgi:hypothetical protein